jgi:uncharacterized protein YhfF
MPDQNIKSFAELGMNFIQYHPTFKSKVCPESLYFCDNEKEADQCAQWIVEGVKQATSTSMLWFETYHQALPKIGDLSILTNWIGKAKESAYDTYDLRMKFSFNR